MEVKNTQSLLVDMLNKAYLFDAKLEKEDHMSKNQIIWFLVHQVHQMESTINRMQTLAKNMNLDI